MRNKIQISMLALPLSLTVVLGVGMARAQTTKPLPVCDQMVSETTPTETSCQIAGQTENCSGAPLGYGGNFEVSRTDGTIGWTNGYSYECSSWSRTGNCCTNVASPLPSCPADTCAPTAP